eukprot:Hpha_TRINITY_DN15000_c3_g7::TRINITY_DN15000_c3_g7_i4::g.125460::m.125460
MAGRPKAALYPHTQDDLALLMDALAEVEQEVAFRAGRPECRAELQRRMRLWAGGSDSVVPTSGSAFGKWFRETTHVRRSRGGAALLALQQKVLEAARIVQDLDGTLLEPRRQGPGAQDGADQEPAEGGSLGPRLPLAEAAAALGIKPQAKAGKKKAKKKAVRGECNPAMVWQAQPAAADLLERGGSPEPRPPPASSPSRKRAKSAPRPSPGGLSRSPPAKRHRCRSLPRLAPSKPLSDAEWRRKVDLQILVLHSRMMAMEHRRRLKSHPPGVRSAVAAATVSSTLQWGLAKAGSWVGGAAGAAGGPT